MARAPSFEASLATVARCLAAFAPAVAHRLAAYAAAKLVRYRGDRVEEPRLKSYGLYPLELRRHGDGSLVFTRQQSGWSLDAQLPAASTSPPGRAPRIAELRLSDRRPQQ